VQSPLHALAQKFVIPEAKRKLQGSLSLDLVRITAPNLFLQEFLKRSSGQGIQEVQMKTEVILFPVREAKALQLDILAREAELKALRAQVDPHFLFNSRNFHQRFDHDRSRGPAADVRSAGGFSAQFA
jgi:LytS/YehU family sensor histidine kinase